jgi:hypothetical protein
MPYAYREYGGQMRAGSTHVTDPQPLFAAVE